MFRSAAFVAALLAGTSASAETYAIQAGRLIVDAASPERGPSTVIVENGRIARIEGGYTMPAGATLVETGTLEPGKSADLIAVDGDPLTDPAAVTHVGYVMVMGKPVPMQ